MIPAAASTTKQPTGNLPGLDPEFAAACMIAAGDVLKALATDLGVADETKHLWGPESLTRFGGREGRAGRPAG